MPRTTTKTAKSRLADYETRQRNLTRHIGENLLRANNLVPFGPHSSFQQVVLNPTCVFNERLCDLVWQTIAYRMSEHDSYQQADNYEALCRVIDHAWMFGINDMLREPWGFVTEPYIEEDRARAFLHIARETMSGWGVEFHLLPSEFSSWYPGSCRPIVACYAGGIENLYREPIKWLLDQVFPDMEDAIERADQDYRIGPDEDYD